MYTLVPVLKISNDAIIPEMATPGSAGVDICSIENYTILPGETKLIRTGLSVELPVGTVFILAARSGLALNTTYLIKNGIGVIDSDYRGEIGVIIHNLSQGDEFVHITKGMRIAQLILLSYEKPMFKETADLTGTSRGSNGFGSTGV